MNRIHTLCSALKQFGLTKSAGKMLNLTAKDLDDLIEFNYANRSLELYCSGNAEPKYCNKLIETINQVQRRMSEEANVASDAIQIKNLNLRYMMRDWLILSHNFASIIPELGITREIFTEWLMEDILPEVENTISSVEKYLNIYNDGFNIDDYNPDQEDHETISQNKSYFDMMRREILADLDAGGSLGLPFSKVQQLLLSTTNITQERALAAKLLSRILAI